MNDPRLKLEMHDGAIVISLPGTNYQVSYRRLADSPGMSASHNLMDDEDAPITPFEFLERAWGIARDKARELGWMSPARIRAEPIVLATVHVFIPAPGGVSRKDMTSS